MKTNEIIKTLIDIEQQHEQRPNRISYTIYQNTLPIILQCLRNQIDRNAMVSDAIHNPLPNHLDIFYRDQFKSVQRNMKFDFDENEKNVFKEAAKSVDDLRKMIEELKYDPEDDSNKSIAEMLFDSSKERYSADIDQILNKAQIAANNGDLRINLNSEPPETVVEYLRRSGFKVYQESGESNDWFLDWKEPKKNKS